ncbi:hypothetical protein BS47DRAFT_1349841 [Hydnum rufescens UP504]|uniref:Uncharacterized protein n=1 Tax=Hydnum rufescens UP504 TaxID=1448309 RepID=A0A9P6ANV5_9AGAM|nr:hypothetical protein BS47DRAFT_1349841 [Hydnum rufescens UP504]
MCAMAGRGRTPFAPQQLRNKLYRFRAADATGMETIEPLAISFFRDEWCCFPTGYSLSAGHVQAADNIKREGGYECGSWVRAHIYLELGTTPYYAITVLSLTGDISKPQ